MPVNLAASDERRAELHAAFVAFGSVSEQLSAAFEGLRNQVAELRRELGEATAGRDHLAARLAALIKGLPGGVLVLDPQGRITECNPAACELLGQPLTDAHFTHVMARAAGGRGGELTELSSGRFVKISRRELSGGGEVVLLTDVTESHLMQRLIARQQRLLTLGELAAGLAHQIRTPLAAALLYASQIMLPGRSAADSARCAEKTAESLKQLDTLVTDMLAFAHGGAARETVNVNALLEQVAQWLRPALTAGTRLTIRTEAVNLAVRANASSLASAVLNLATNALQAAGGALELEILARRRGDRAQIVVSDDGPGVPAALRARIFEPFFSTRARGNGIGLAIVKSVVEAHAGNVYLADSGGADSAGAESGGVGGGGDGGRARGAVFVIDLPAEDAT